MDNFYITSITPYKITSEEETLTAMLWTQVQQQPDAIAVVSEQSSLTYRQLLDNALQLSMHLHKIGVQVDDCVGIFVDSSLEMMTGTWGILFSGSAYLPLSPEYPDERIRHMVKDSRAKVIVTQRHLIKKLSDITLSDINIIILEDIAVVPPPVNIEAHTIKSHDLAYIIYTSGTSGKPKGVAIEHRSITSQMKWLYANYGINRDKIILRKTPMSFDAAQWELLAVACGSQIIMGKPQIHRDPKELISTIVQHHVTTLQCVPTLLQALIEHPDITYCKTLKQIFSGGEALSKKLALNCLDVLPDSTLINLYGPTECTINTSAYNVTLDAAKHASQVVSIGFPVADTHFFVLDSLQHPVSLGITGELYISGKQLARGYLHHPDLSKERFPLIKLSDSSSTIRMYRTGDNVQQNEDGSFQFIGRIDNQIKLRGFRIELDEIRIVIENHNWVKNAAILVNEDVRTKAQSLIACVELNPREAALMDQGSHGTHHQSKESRLQVKAQLSSHGLRKLSQDEQNRLINLPGAEPNTEQRSRIFARKTYRSFDGSPVSKDEILKLLARQLPEAEPRHLDALNLDILASFLRPFGQYKSAERLLPKYGYASPGALYATQLYLELHHIAGLAAGYYYYHPEHHQLVLIKSITSQKKSEIKIHFIGKKSAIESVYKNNVREVLEIEAGHMLGLFDETLPEYGLGVGKGHYEPWIKEHLACDENDDYIASFELVPLSERQGYGPLDIYFQPHFGRVLGLGENQYRYFGGQFEPISHNLVLKKHVIAINQKPFEHSSFGITVISKNTEDWACYLDLGRKLQSLQMNNLNLGFMSSGYSSKTGNNLLSAIRINSILSERKEESGPSYFFLGGKVSKEQISSEGMKEDIIHMLGPAEIIKKDIENYLPDYMVPNKIIILDSLPHTPNGKIDLKALALHERVAFAADRNVFISPKTNTEIQLANIWVKLMNCETVSIKDDFFEQGGNSLLAIRLVHEINSTLSLTLPLQIIFEDTTIERLASRIDTLGEAVSISRLIPLQPDGPNNPIYCWPGLGGYPMNLRPLATKINLARPFYGIQAHGLNKNEEIYSTIQRMAAEDIKMIKRLQPHGPYTLCGYSFGARIAFETAFQLESVGEKVEHLFLIAPGSPQLSENLSNEEYSEVSYRNPSYLTILLSVFSGNITSPALTECLKSCHDESSFLFFITKRYPNIDPGLVRRIMKLVYKSYEFTYHFHEMRTKKIAAPMTVFKARGDDYSFIENNLEYLSTPPTIVELHADHYELLKEPNLDELIKEIQHQLKDITKPEHTIKVEENEEITMPHVNIKYFPVNITDEQRYELITAITHAVRIAFGCNEGVISIALEPIEKELWGEHVDIPEIKKRAHLLYKSPNY